MPGHGKQTHGKALSDSLPRCAFCGHMANRHRRSYQPNEPRYGECRYRKTCKCGSYRPKVGAMPMNGSWV